MKKRNPITEGMVSKFMDNLFTNIKNNNRARNIKALKSDPQLARAEEKLAGAFANLEKIIKKHKQYK
jgi:hypothetical protein